MRRCHDCREPLSEGSRCPICQDRHRSQERKRKERLREEGKCLFCGALLLDDSFVLCPRCRIRKRIQRRSPDILPDPASGSDQGRR